MNPPILFRCLAIKTIYVSDACNHSLWIFSMSYLYCCTKLLFFTSNELPSSSSHSSLAVPICLNLLLLSVFLLCWLTLPRFVDLLVLSRGKVGPLSESSQRLYANDSSSPSALLACRSFWLELFLLSSGFFWLL